MKLLSICIPTYNREIEFKYLYDSFLTKVLNSYSDVVEIVVCDNSVNKISKANESILDARVRYYYNEVNIGFAKNFIRCFNESSGEFVWIISDDDFVLWEGFVGILESIRESKKEKYDCFMVPFFSKTPFGDVVFSNRDSDWGLRTGATVLELISTTQCPFILFSGAVLRVDKSVLSRIEPKHMNNAYIQTILFLNMLKPSSRINFLKLEALEYQPGYIGQTIGVAEMANSLYEVRKFMEERFGVKSDFDSDYNGWLLWLVHHRGGLYYLFNAETDRWAMLSMLNNHLSLKSIFLAIAILLPKIIIRPVYLIYKTLTDTKLYGYTGVRDLFKRFSIYQKFISAIIKRHPSKNNLK